MSKFAVILYPDFSLQEITCLTSALSVWFEEKIDFIASENREYCSEEGLRVMPTKTIADVNITDYKCIVLPGTINPLPALYDDRLIEFLRGGINTDVTFAAISSSPILLAKAGVLDGRMPALALPRVAALRVLAPGGKQGGAVPPSARARRAPDRQSGRAGRGERAACRKNAIGRPFDAS